MISAAAAAAAAVAVTAATVAAASPTRYERTLRNCMAFALCNTSKLAQEAQEKLLFIAGAVDVLEHLL
jgi:hypothetical protein